MTGKVPTVVEFEASLPTNRMAFGFTGDGDAKVSLDVDATQLGNAISAFIAMRGKRVKVVMQSIPDKPTVREE